MTVFRACLILHAFFVMFISSTTNAHFFEKKGKEKPGYSIPYAVMLPPIDFGSYHHGHHGHYESHGNAYNGYKIYDQHGHGSFGWSSHPHTSDYGYGDNHKYQHGYMGTSNHNEAHGHGLNTHTYMPHKVYATPPPQIYTQPKIYPAPQISYKPPILPPPPQIYTQPKIYPAPQMSYKPPILPPPPQIYTQPKIYPAPQISYKPPILPPPPQMYTQPKIYPAPQIFPPPALYSPPQMIVPAPHTLPVPQIYPSPHIYSPQPQEYYHPQPLYPPIQNTYGGNSMTQGTDEFSESKYGTGVLFTHGARVADPGPKKGKKIKKNDKHRSADGVPLSMHAVSSSTIHDNVHPHHDTEELPTIVHHNPEHLMKDPHHLHKIKEIILEKEGSGVKVQKMIEFDFSRADQSGHPVQEQVPPHLPTPGHHIRKRSVSLHEDVNGTTSLLQRKNKSFETIEASDSDNNNRTARYIPHHFMMPPVQPLIHPRPIIHPHPYIHRPLIHHPVLHPPLLPHPHLPLPVHAHLLRARARARMMTPLRRSKTYFNSYHPGQMIGNIYKPPVRTSYYRYRRSIDFDNINNNQTISSEQNQIEASFSLPSNQSLITDEPKYQPHIIFTLPPTHNNNANLFLPLKVQHQTLQNHHLTIRSASYQPYYYKKPVTYMKPPIIFPPQAPYGYELKTVNPSLPPTPVHMHNFHKSIHNEMPEMPHGSPDHNEHLIDPRLITPHKAPPPHHELLPSSQNEKLDQKELHKNHHAGTTPQQVEFPYPYQGKHPEHIHLPQDAHERSAKPHMLHKTIIHSPPPMYVQIPHPPPPKPHYVVHKVPHFYKKPVGYAPVHVHEHAEHGKSMQRMMYSPTQQSPFPHHPVITDLQPPIHFHYQLPPSPHY